MAIQFERSALYEEVWTTPLTKLGLKYGMSDNGIRKICKALNIPLPKAGHWARVASGQKMPRKPLPPRAERTSFVSQPPEQSPVNQKLDPEIEWLQQREQYEKDSQNEIVVDVEAVKLHPLLVKAPGIYKRLQQELEKAKLEAAKPRHAIKGRWEPNFAGMKWSMYEQRGLMLETSDLNLPFKFSSGTWKRGLAIASALLIAAEKRGFTIIKSEESSSILLEVFEGRVSIKLTEKFGNELRQRNNPSEVDLLLGPSRYKIPSGILRLHLNVNGRSSEILIADSDSNFLEKSLNLAFIKIYRLVVQDRIWHRKMQELRRQEEDRRLRIAEQEKVREQLLKEQQLAKARKEELLQEAEDWHKAQQLHRYIEHLHHELISKNLTEKDEYLKWRIWAIQIAEHLDPTSNRIQSLSKNDGSDE